MDQAIPSILLGVGLFVVYLLYSKWRENKDLEARRIAAEEERKQNPIVNNDEPVTTAMTLEELAPYNGVQNEKVYIAVKNMVFDVTSSESYRPGGGYSKFAGKECSVALAKMSMDDKYFNCYDGYKFPLAEMDSLQGWFDFMKKKYKIVAYITASKKDD